jgi:hypothetical protein
MNKDGGGGCGGGGVDFDAVLECYSSWQRKNQIYAYPTDGGRGVRKYCCSSIFAAASLSTSTFFVALFSPTHFRTTARHATLSRMVVTIVLSLPCLPADN